MTESGTDAPAGRTGTQVRMESLRRHYGPVIALDDLSLTLEPGELVALLGPSGCGKTTALRLLAGLDDVDSGRVIVNGTDVTRLPANKRDMGMVFQAYSLFPHMTALQNVAFGLRLRRVNRVGRRNRAGNMLDLVGLSAQADRYPHQMSGGQQQRVALARALAIRPTVLLLDEPLAALDARVRAALRDEIRRVQLEVGTTTLFVTHDQEEALGIADRIGVMRAGRLEQLGAPVDIYSRPKTRFVAEFVGLSNQLPARVAGGTVDILGVRRPLADPSTPDGDAIAIIRPEAIAITVDAPAADGQNPLVGTVRTITFQGALSRIAIALDAGPIVLVQLSTDRIDAFHVGTRVRLELRPDPVFVTRPELDKQDALSQRAISPPRQEYS